MVGRDCSAYCTPEKVILGGQKDRFDSYFFLGVSSE